jgi:oxygen-independent coproporphyrinogen-3 oxidase
MSAGVPAGLYIHYPYCVSKCPYCDFNSQASAPVQGEFAGAVSRELAARACAFSGLKFGSVYFGGGTPSLWEPDCVAAVLQTSRAALAFEDDPEITLEANPGTVDNNRLLAYREAGVNRLSLGIQSLDGAELEALGRIHGVTEALDALSSAVGAGFANIGADLIYGIRGQTTASFLRSLEGVVKAGTTHVSAYSLTIAEGTPLARQVAEGLELPDDGENAELYGVARRFLASAGFGRYEVSNWARPGMECRHNVNCWRGGFYLGAGPGAHGHAQVTPEQRDAIIAAKQGGCRGEGGGCSSCGPGDVPGGGSGEWLSIRYFNAGDPAEWLAAITAGRPPPGAAEPVGALERARELIYLGLRTAEGLDMAALEADTGPALAAEILRKAGGLEDEGLARVEKGRVRLSDRGVLFADRAALHLLP